MRNWLAVILFLTLSLRAPAWQIVNRQGGQWYFCCTATDSTGLESDYSVEAEYVATKWTIGVTLAWDACESVEWQMVDGQWRQACVGIDHYTIYYGGESGSYTNSVNAGTNTTCRVLLGAVGPFPPPQQGSNLVIVVTWPDDSTTSITNPAEPMQFWRGAKGISTLRFNQ